MEFRTIVNIPRPTFELEPCERILFVGSCFADNIGKRFEEEKFRAVVNPFGVMYNPVSVLHTARKMAGTPFDTAVFTLGTNHVYVERATGEIVDNCQKRPQRAFEERELTIDECADALREAISLLRTSNPRLRVIVTVSPIRYAKYGYHESQLSKAVLLLAADKLTKEASGEVYYFPAYVAYIWEQLVATCFSATAKQFLKEWRPIKEALAHRPFHPEAASYQDFLKKTKEAARLLKQKYPNLELKE